MSDKPRQYSPGEINSIFARLDPQDVERFYQNYQLWTLQQQIVGLQTQITGLQQQIAENNERMQQAHPSAIALATLAQLQSYGVTDIDLLDLMLERGESWLNQTMQRLAYCEQFDFIRSNNYKESSLAATSTTPAANMNSTLDEATEEILLQKLMSDEEAFMLEATLKRPAVSPAQSGETASPVDTSLAADTQPDLPHTPTEPASTLEQAEDVPVQEEPETGHPPAEPPQQELETGHPPAEPPQLEVEQPAQPQLTASTSETSEEHAQPDESAVPTQEEMIHAKGDDAHNQESTQRSNQHLQVTKPQRKRSFLRRLIAVFFHV